MRDKFPGFYRPTEEEFDQLWQECVFTFDANVLLNTYSYTPKTHDEFFNILNKLKDRIWISHQAALEYQRNRVSVIAQQIGVYDTLLKQLPKLQKSRFAVSELGEHPSIEVDKLRDRIKQVESSVEETINSLEQEIRELREKHPDWSFDNDTIRDNLDDLFANRIGPPYTDEQLQKIFDEGDDRYLCNRPPGFADSFKKGSDKFGDLIIWYQIIDYAKANQKAIIFITDDEKNDWWLESRNKTVGPHPELIQELRQIANVKFYAYTADKFMEYAKQNLGLHASDESIEEAEKVRKNNETIEELTKDIRRELLHVSSQAKITNAEEHLLRILQHRPSPEGIMDVRRSLELATQAREEFERTSAQRQQIERDVERANIARQQFELYRPYLSQIRPEENPTPEEDNTEN